MLKSTTAPRIAAQISTNLGGYEGAAWKDFASELSSRDGSKPSILALIVLAAVLVGAETYPTVYERYRGLLNALNQIVLWIFVAEAALKMARHGQRWYRYFFDPWNVFDFVIVAVCFLPINTSYAAVLRLARIMRALRLLTALPQLQLIVGALIKSIPSMIYVGILLALNFYVYAVMGVFLFGENDPVHFRDLPTAMLSLFRVVTLEDWTDVMYLQMLGSDVYEYHNTSNIQEVPNAMPLVGATYFVTFVMFGTMIMLNLFIGVILNSMEEARLEQGREHIREQIEKGERKTPSGEIEVIQEKIEELQRLLKDLKLQVSK